MPLKNMVNVFAVVYLKNIFAFSKTYSLHSTCKATGQVIL